MVGDDLSEADIEGAREMEKCMGEQKSSSKRKINEFEDRLEIKIGMTQNKKIPTKVR